VLGDHEQLSGEGQVAPEELAAVLRRQPFVPFRMTLTEGSTYDVRHPELCMSGRRSAIIGIADPDDRDRLFERSVTVDLLHIVRLESLETVPRRENGPS
jgi:hypothetical protein